LAEALSSTNDNEELMKISAELEEVVKECDAKNDRWLELAEWAE
jgi:hypothetical protein